MIEKVEIAIRNNVINHDSSYANIKEIAILAITAMREPTEEMLNSRENPKKAVHLWRDMIDAALKE